MTSVLIERADNAYLLIVQDQVKGTRKVVTVPFEGDAPGYEAESKAVHLLMSVVVS